MLGDDREQVAEQARRSSSPSSLDRLLDRALLILWLSAIPLRVGDQSRQAKRTSLAGGWQAPLQTSPASMRHAPRSVTISLRRRGPAPARQAPRPPRPRGLRVAQHQARFAHAAPLVDLQRERRIRRHAVAHRQAGAGAERHRTGAGAVGEHREAHVPALPHRLRSAKRAPRTSSDTAGLAQPNGASARSSSASAIPSSPPCTTASTRSLRPAAPRSGHARRVLRTPLRTPPGARARSPGPPPRGGRRGVPGVPRTRPGRPAGRSPRCCAPDPRPRSPSSATSTNGRWWRSARREATIPITPGCHSSPASTYPARSPAAATWRSASNRMRVSVCRRSWLARSSSAAIVLRARGVLGEDQLEAGVGAVHPPRRVQPRRQRERHGALVELRLRMARATASSARRPGLAVRRQRPQAARTSARFSPSSATTSAISRAPRGRGRRAGDKSRRPAPTSRPGHGTPRPPTAPSASL